MLWIRDILVRIRIRGSVPLTRGSGFGSCSFCQWIPRCSFSKVHLRQSSKIRHIEVGRSGSGRPKNLRIQIHNRAEPLVTYVRYGTVPVLIKISWLIKDISGIAIDQTELSVTYAYWSGHGWNNVLFVHDLPILYVPYATLLYLYFSIYPFIIIFVLQEWWAVLWLQRAEGVLRHRQVHEGSGEEHHRAAYVGTVAVHLQSSFKILKKPFPIRWTIFLNNKDQIDIFFSSVADPDPNPDPHVLGPPGSGSISQRYPIIKQNSKKNLDFYWFGTSFWFFIFEKWCKSTFKK